MNLTLLGDVWSIDVGEVRIPNMSDRVSSLCIANLETPIYPEVHLLAPSLVRTSYQTVRPCLCYGMLSMESVSPWQTSTQWTMVR